MPPHKPGMALSQDNQKANQTGAITAHELCPGGIESEPKRLGRRLVLKFIGGDHPELDRIQCRWSEPSQVAYWQQGEPQDKNPMSWTPVPQALALIFLDYLCAAGTETVGPTNFFDADNGGLATALGNAISDKQGKLHELFVERLPHRFPMTRVRKVFGGKNFRDKEEGERRVFVQEDHLPHDCIEVYWALGGTGQITNPEILRELARRIRSSLGIPVKPGPQIGEGELGSKARPAPVAKSAPPKPAPAQQPELPKAEPQAPAEPVQSL